jgi:anti-anti-sigma factor
MELAEEPAAGCTIVAISGRLDAAAARQLGERLATLIKIGQSRLLIEASRLDYVGSLGLRALLVTARLAAEAQGRLAFCSFTAPVRQVVELAGFGEVFERYASREEALAKLCAEA